MILRGAFGVMLALEILEYYMYTPVSRASQALKSLPYNTFFVLMCGDTACTVPELVEGSMTKGNNFFVRFKV